MYVAVGVKIANARDHPAQRGLIESRYSSDRFALAPNARAGGIEPLLDLGISLNSRRSDLTGLDRRRSHVHIYFFFLLISPSSTVDDNAIGRRSESLRNSDSKRLR